jgi:signal transduction histidine kinase
VTIRSVAHGEEILLTITDTGGGIPPELHSRLFDRYQSSVALRQETGAGLGLFIVKTLVEAHGGRVEVRSTPGEGTTFAVFLPAAAPRAASAG